ncbi:hypothetical protein DYY65_00845 [Nitrososphaera sp. AFS]|nr:hypothetical protein [Nitrososphaera sp. AFS]
MIKLELPFQGGLRLIDSEKRFCDRCMTRTLHQTVEEDEVIYAYKRRRSYRCSTCGRTSVRRGLRPSAESVY